MPRTTPCSFPIPKKKRPAKKSTADRARHLVDQCPHKITGIVNIPGLQLQAPEHESLPESFALKLLALCHDVVAIESQPEKITWINSEGAPRKYTVDIRVTLNNGDKIRVEVKPVAHVLSEEMLKKLLSVATHYASRNQRYDIFSEEAVQLEPRLSIAIRLRGFLKQTVPNEIRNKIEGLLADGAKRINDLLSVLGGAQFWSHILALIAQRHLCIPWTEPFSRNMQISLPNQPFGYLTYDAIANSGRFRPLLQDVVLGRRPTDQHLLASACAKDRSISLPSPMGVVGDLPRRAMQVGREIRQFSDRADGHPNIAAPGKSIDGAI